MRPDCHQCHQLSTCQLSCVNRPLSTINTYPSTIYHRDLTINHPPSRLVCRPSTIHYQHSSVNRQPFTIDTRPSTVNYQYLSVHPLSTANTQPTPLCSSTSPPPVLFSRHTDMFAHRLTPCRHHLGYRPSHKVRPLNLSFNMHDVDLILTDRLPALSLVDHTTTLGHPPALGLIDHIPTLDHLLLSPLLATCLLSIICPLSSPLRPLPHKTCAHFVVVVAVLPADV